MNRRGFLTPPCPPQKGDAQSGSRCEAQPRRGGTTLTRCKHSAASGSTPTGQRPVGVPLLRGCPKGGGVKKPEQRKYNNQKHTTMKN